MDPAAVMKRAEYYRDEMVAFLRDIIAIPSESTQEKKVIARIAKELRKRRAYDEIRTDGLGNLFARIGKGPRVIAIDIVRALTMILMIFVNDLWSLSNIPAWLGHVDRGVDGIGLADVVFPAFLFIVGLSLPYAIDARIKKGDTTGQLVKHVLTRTIALLVMGVFLVNGETDNAVHRPVGRPHTRDAGT